MPKVCNRHRFGAIGILIANASVIQVADHFAYWKYSFSSQRVEKWQRGMKIRASGLADHVLSPVTKTGIFALSI